MIYRKSSLLLFFATFFMWSCIEASFIEGTLVKTTQGLVPIQELQVNDEVYAYDTDKNEFVVRSIIATRSHEIPSVIHVQANNNHLFADAEQLFYLVLEKKWCCAKDLQPGMLLQSYDGQKVLVERVNELNVSSIVHDLALNEPHSFCVTGDGIVVHNVVVAIPILYFGAGGISLASGILYSAACGFGAILCYKLLADTTGATIDQNLDISQANFLGSQELNFNHGMSYKPQAEHYSLTPDYSQAHAQNNAFVCPKTAAGLGGSHLERNLGVHDTRSFPIPTFPTTNACLVPDKSTNIPEISKCPPHKEEENLPTFGCGLPELPEPIITGVCLPDTQVPDRGNCPDIIGMWDPEDAVTECNWGKYLKIPGIVDISPESDSQEAPESCENAPNSEDEITGQSDDNISAKPPKNQRPPKDTDRPWDLPKHDPAIDIDKIDFSLTPHLTEDEIELIKQCIKLFLDVEGFLAHDGALWRILKFEDQKKGSLFELEYIDKLHDQNRAIIKMGEEVKIGKEEIEIDIETDTELIECKSGVWELKREKEIKDLRDKLILGNEYGKNIKKLFVVVSKKAIPLIWKNWLDQNNINYREETNE